jgi:uncharacterized pyridoxamine 5'-phosphate oxidase family protein
MYVLNAYDHIIYTCQECYTKQYTEIINEKKVVLTTCHTKGLGTDKRTNINITQDRNRRQNFVNMVTILQEP